MQRLHRWLRPPRSLLIVFLLVVAVPAATLIAVGVRLLEQDRALARQRQSEILESATDRAVSALKQDLVLWTKRLADPKWAPTEPLDDSIYLILRADQVQAIPAGSLPYFPLAATLMEVSAEPFRDLENQEFRAESLTRALELSRRIRESPDPRLQAGALLREARILRKIGQPDEALRVYSALKRFDSIAIDGHPADLLAWRSRCALLQQLSRNEQLRAEATELAANLRAGRWQLDRATYLHVSTQLSGWVGADVRASKPSEAMAEAVGWLHGKWTNGRADDLGSFGAQLLQTNDLPVTILWAADAVRLRAFVAGPGYTEKRWLSQAREAANPARAYLIAAGGRPVVGDAPSANARRVQRAASETGLPWTLVVTGAAPAEEYSAGIARRRTLLAGFAAMLAFICAGSYFTWRLVSRELAFARLQSEFVSDVSHEFRTPLTALRQFNDLLEQDEALTAEKRRSYHEAQARATERLQRFVESLLDFGRMEAGRRPYRFAPVDVAALVREVASGFSDDAKDRGFTIGCKIDNGECLVEADAEALSHAVWNLLDNAAKYSGDSRRIDVTVSRSRCHVAIAVRDHGVGIPAAERKSIFEKFVRGSTAKALGVKGTGIGLAMVKHIVGAHGGNVVLASCPGQGSTFTIFLPVKE